MLKTRFAPSPTGLMHFGNFRTALFNFLYAKKEKGVFLLRVEDTDQSRSKQEYVDALLSDFDATNIKFQEGPFFQSKRKDIYDKYYDMLVAEKLAYPCFCTEQQLAISRKLQFSQGRPPRYSGTCRSLSSDEIQMKLDNSLKPTLRFNMSKDEVIEFNDLIKGKQRFLNKDIGDFIIRRMDGSASFMFANAIDDSLMEVTHVLRGEDHLTNTPRQISILKSLGLKLPNYGHFSLIHGQDGAPLSKRNGSLAIIELFEQGYLPQAIISYLARLGHYCNDKNLLSLDELALKFDLSNISTSFAKHDISHLKYWQKEVMLKLSEEELLSMIKNYIPHDIEKTLSKEKKLQFTKIIQPNLLLLTDAKIWVSVFFNDKLNFSDSAKKIFQECPDGFFSYAHDLLNKLEQDKVITFVELAASIKEKFKVKGKKLFMPLRLALTGLDYGPELGEILNFMGKDLAKERFKKIASSLRA